MNDFLEWEIVWNRFSFFEFYYELWLKMLEHYGAFGEKMLSQHDVFLTSQEWVGMYMAQEDSLPKWEVKYDYLK